MSNSINILFCNANDIDLSNYKRFEKDLKSIINWKQFKSYKNEINQKEYLISSLLIANILNKFKIPANQLVRKQNKKPFIKSNKIYFSISHSNGLVVLAYDNKPVGCDIETIVESDFNKISKNIFSVEENLLVNKQEKSFDVFYKIWCCKESLIKILDLGISKIKKTSIQFKKEWETSYLNNEYYFCTKKIGKSMMAVCSVKKNLNIKISKIKF